MASKRFNSGQFICQAQDCLRPKAHDHHVVYRQHVEKAGGDINDPRNALAVCWDCHGFHHNALRGGQRWRIKTCCLRNENIEFAFELLGQATYSYFDRYYDNDARDRRIEAAIQVLEREAA